MAAAETLAIARVIDDNVKDMNEKVGGVNGRVNGIADKIGSLVKGE
jgi:hypothetical protein